MMQTLYASRVPSDDYYDQQIPSEYPKYFDIVISDQTGKVVMRFLWHYQSKPDKRNKYIMYNCQRHHLKWRD